MPPISRAEELPDTTAAPTRIGEDGLSRWRVLAWILIPALVFGGVEKRMHSWIMHREGAYAGVMAYPPAKHVDLVFIGVSRVEAAIESEAFDEVVSRANGKPFYSLNMGGGDRIPLVHYLGLRNLFRAHPTQFKGCTVLLEAPCGIPTWSKWEDPWIGTEYARMVMSDVTAEDLPRLSTSERSMADRLTMYEMYAERDIALVYYRGMVRRRLEGKLSTKMEGIAGRFHLLRRDNSAPSDLDLNAGGDIRVDPGAVEVGREAMNRDVNSAKTTPVDADDWNRTVVGDIRKLVETNGGRLVLFEMPVHSLYHEIYAQPSYIAMRDLLERQRRSLNVPLIHADFPYSDVDFPDYWHLRKSRSREFSARLAEAWIRETGNCYPEPNP